MTANSEPSLGLPIFDLSKFQKGREDGKQKTAQEVVSAFKTYGFVYLVNHGI